MNILHKIFITFSILVIATTVYAGVDLPWSTTYDCVDWEQGDPTLTCDSIQVYLSATCDQGGTHKEQITSSANNPNGGGGKGQRHWEGDGQNHSSGGTKILFNSTQKELWVRWYMRYQSGFQWTGSQPGYDKWLYFLFGTATDVVPEWFGNEVNIWVSPDNNLSTGSKGWPAVMGGSLSDGLFHCYEIHLKNNGGNNGIAEMWIDGVLKLSYNNINYGDSNAGWDGFVIGSNQNSPDNGGCTAVDFDDIAVSNTGRIGCLHQSMSLTGSQSLMWGSGDKTLTFGN